MKPAAYKYASVRYYTWDVIDSNGADDINVFGKKNEHYVEEDCFLSRYVFTSEEAAQYFIEKYFTHFVPVARFNDWDDVYYDSLDSLSVPIRVTDKIFKFVDLYQMEHGPYYIVFQLKLHANAYPIKFDDPE